MLLLTGEGSEAAERREGGGELRERRHDALLSQLSNAIHSPTWSPGVASRRAAWRPECQVLGSVKCLSSASTAEYCFSDLCCGMSSRTAVILPDAHLGTGPVNTPLTKASLQSQRDEHVSNSEAGRQQFAKEDKAKEASITRQKDSGAKVTRSRQLHYTWAVFSIQLPTSWSL